MRIIFVILFAVLVANLGTSHARAAGAAEVRMDHISIVTAGRGSPVVLIPGLASPRAVWDGVAPDLAKRHKLILVQVNGFGGDPAGANARPGVLEGIVADLAAYLREEKIEKPAIIGHSLGGLVGMMLVKVHPQAVGRLMIVDALPFYGMLMGPAATPDSVRPLAEQMRAMLVNGPAPSQAPPYMSLTAEGQAKVLEWLKASDRAAVGQAMVEDATLDFRPELPKIAQVPVTVLYAVPTRERADLARGLYQSAYAGLPSAKLVAIDRSAHFIMLDQSGRFAEEVDKFLRP